MANGQSQKAESTLRPQSSNEKVIAKVAEANEADVDAAVSAAEKAFKGWSSISGKERGKYLFRLARLIQEKARELSVIETLDGGKPIRESRDIDIPLAAASFLLSCRMGR